MSGGERQPRWKGRSHWRIASVSDCHGHKSQKKAKCVREIIAHLLTLQRRVVLALFLFADDTKLGKVAQLRVDGEVAKLVVGPGEEVCRVCTSREPVRVIGD